VLQSVASASKRATSRLRFVNRRGGGGAGRGARGGWGVGGWRVGGGGGGDSSTSATTHLQSKTNIRDGSLIPLQCRKELRIIGKVCGKC